MSWTRFLHELSQRAAQRGVTIYDLALAAWQDSERRIRDMCAGIDYPIEAIKTLLMDAVREGVADEPPPLVENGPPRYVVVIRGDAYTDYSNKYATFEDAEFALAHLSAQFFGTPKPSPLRDRHVFIIIKERVEHPRAVFVRELP